jgi:hypothetical protein
MRRREFMAGLAGAAAMPVVARAQQAATFDPILPRTFSHLISPDRRNILAPAGKIILE